MVMEKKDDAMGMTWWNGMSQPERHEVLHQADALIRGASVAQAWRLWKAHRITMNQHQTTPGPRLKWLWKRSTATQPLPEKTSHPTTGSPPHAIPKRQPNHRAHMPRGNTQHKNRDQHHTTYVHTTVQHDRKPVPRRHEDPPTRRKRPYRRFNHRRSPQRNPSNPRFNSLNPLRPPGPPPGGGKPHYSRQCYQHKENSPKSVLPRLRRYPQFNCPRRSHVPLIAHARVNMTDPTPGICLRNIHNDFTLRRTGMCHRSASSGKSRPMFAGTS